MKKTGFFLVVMVLMIAIFSSSHAEEELFYDDGEHEGYGIGGSVDDVAAVIFTPSQYPANIKQARVFIDTPQTFRLRVFNVNDINSGPDVAIIEALVQQPTAAGWHTIDLSMYDITIISGHFAIGLEWAVNGEPLLLGDESPPIFNRSWMWSGSGWNPITQYPSFNADLMIRASVEYGLRDCLLELNVSPLLGGTTSPKPGSHFIAGCTQVTIKAIPNIGFTFSHWEGDAQGSDNPITVTGGFITAVFDYCIARSVYGNGSEEVKVLRKFRDDVLSQTPEGQELIKLYYQWSPAIVKAMEEDEEFKEDIKEMVDGVLELIIEEAE